MPSQASVSPGGAPLSLVFSLFCFHCLVTFGLRCLLFPLQIKQMKAQSKMVEIQPKLNALMDKMKIASLNGETDLTSYQLETRVFFRFFKNFIIVEFIQICRLEPLLSCCQQFCSIACPAVPLLGSRTMCQDHS